MVKKVKEETTSGKTVLMVLAWICFGVSICHVAMASGTTSETIMHQMYYGLGAIGSMLTAIFFVLVAK